MARRPAVPDEATNSAALSLLELRRHLLRQAGALSARARGLRRQGAQRNAAKLAGESDRLLSLAKNMGDDDSP